ncbi:MAG: hypothetical protein GX428_11120 [Candidatus Atribacteria bacterium]|nr:hypothetical protein [Candidatus Atribacteria bacterium]
MKDTQKKIFLLGYYGFGNWGDELSLQSIISDLEIISKDIPYSFLYSVLTRDNRFFPRPFSILSVIIRKKIITVLKEITKSDFVVIGGGSLLQDSTSFRSLIYYSFLLWWALIFHRPLIFYRCGLGPFHKALSRKLVSFILKRIKLFIARDQESAELATKLSGYSNRIKIGIDPVVSNYSNTLPITQDKPIVSFFVRNCSLPYEGKLVDSLNYLQDRIQERIEIVAFHYDYDYKIASRIANQIGCQWKYFQSIEEIPPYFHQLTAVFTMRLHPAILSTMMDVPWFALNIDPKIESFADWWEKKNLVAWQDLSQDAFFRLFEQRENLFRKNNEIKKQLKQLDDQSRIWLREFFDQKNHVH